MEKFAAWLREEMDNAGMSQADLVRASHLSTAQISRIMNMQSPPGKKALEGIARALNIPVELVYQKANIFKASFSPNAQVDVLATEIYTIFSRLPEREKILLRDIARLYYKKYGNRPNPEEEQGLNAPPKNR